MNKRPKRIISALGAFLVTNSPQLLAKTQVLLESDPWDKVIEASKTLQLSPCASLEEIRKTYKEMALKNHPDKNKSPEAAGLMTRLNEAYQFLKEWVETWAPTQDKEETYAPNRSSGSPASAPPSPPPSQKSKAPPLKVFPSFLRLSSEKIQDQPPPPKTEDAPPPFNAFDIEYEQVLSLLERKHYKNFCTAPHISAADFQKTLEKNAHFIHAVILVFSRKSPHTTWKENLAIVNGIISIQEAILGLEESVRSACGPISYEGLINSCFDTTIYNSIHVSF